MLARQHICGTGYLYLMKTIYDLYIFAEELLEYALMGGDDDTAEIIEYTVDMAQSSQSVDEQLAEFMLAFVAIEDRVNAPNYPLDSVIALRTMLRGTNNSMQSRYTH